MTPFEINAAKKEIAKCEEFIACAEGELQFSPNLVSGLAYQSPPQRLVTHEATYRLFTHCHLFYCL